MTNNECQIKIMDIAQNLARIGNWTADSYEEKKMLIKRFLDQTQNYLDDLIFPNSSNDEINILTKFKKEFEKLKREEITNKNKDIWAEKILTWANILQSRAQVEI